MKDEDDDARTSRAFIDVIACAFGAVVLLVLILPVGEPAPPRSGPMSFEPGPLASELQALDERAVRVAAENSARRSELASLQAAAETLNRDAAGRSARQASLASELAALTGRNHGLETALRAAQELAVQAQPKLENQYFGIPVDADHVLFVIDTSGSMQAIHQHVSRVVRNVLSIYPQLSGGIQVINDQGQRLRLSGSGGRWVRDTKTNRRLIAARLSSWRPFSNSSPIEGIQVAVERYVQSGAKTAVFVLGDDYTGTDFDVFLRRVDAIVQRNGIDESLLRIHAIGFENERGSQYPERFGMLMRALSHRYNGVYLYVSTSPPSRINISRGRTAVRSD